MSLGRRKVFFKHDVPISVIVFVRAICADYKRRKQVLFTGKCSPQVAEEYNRINNIIDNCLSDLEKPVRMTLLQDVAERKGYYCSYSRMCLSKGAYYNRKNKLIYDIAHELHYI